MFVLATLKELQLATLNVLLPFVCTLQCSCQCSSDCVQRILLVPLLHFMAKLLQGNT
jgi:hypothetical protein